MNAKQHSQYPRITERDIENGVTQAKYKIENRLASAARWGSKMAFLRQIEQEIAPKIKFNQNAYELASH